MQLIKGLGKKTNTVSNILISQLDSARVKYNSNNMKQRNSYFLHSENDINVVGLTKFQKQHEEMKYFSIFSYHNYDLSLHIFGEKYGNDYSVVYFYEDLSSWNQHTCFRVRLIKLYISVCH